MRTFVLRKEDISSKWYLVDAKDKVLGRLASRLAIILMGKDKPTYSPHLPMGDFVVVINADKIKLTGKKWDTKLYQWHTGYPEGFREIKAKDLFKKSPEKLLWLAVYGMLPKNKLRSKAIKKLKIYCGENHPHIAQKPEKIEI